MRDDASTEGWLPGFCRALKFLWPHRRSLIIGLVMAFGVGAFYTFSISSVVPLLKVIFAEHETLADWLHRVEMQRRLDLNIAADLPDDPGGLRIEHVQRDSRSFGVLRDGDRIAALGEESLSAYDVMRRIAEHRDKSFGPVTIVGDDGARREETLRLRSYHWWSTPLLGIAGVLPSSKEPEARLTTLAMVMGALVFVSLLGGLCRFANEGLVAIAVQRAMHDLRSALAAHVLSLPLDWHVRQPPGDTLGRFATDISKVEVGVSTLFGKVFREPIKAVGVLTLTVLIEWRLLVVALLGLPIGAIVMRFFGRQVKRAQKRASASWGRLLDHLGEKLSGIRVVKAYGMEQSESRRFDHEGRTLTRAQSQIELVDAATNPALETLAICGVAAFVLYGGSRVFSGQLEPHLFFAAVVCLGGIFDPVRKMGNVYNRLNQADVSARRLFELLDLQPEEVQRPVVHELAPLRNAIRFENVSFEYPGTRDKPVLQDIDLEITRGQVVALVGPNGCGKTTLMSLLMRFFEPTAGRIRIDDHDIAHASLESLRAQIGLVTQDSVVFSESVRDNISYGALDATEDQIALAARLAHADDFIEQLSSEENGALLTGLDARITARSLSGGQRQRLALARAILRDPPILILDEATSQIDSESERKIQEAVEDVTRGRTTFIIAHRYSTIARADVIVVMNEGRIIAYGRHADLIGSSPFYVALCETQFAFSG